MYGPDRQRTFWPLLCDLARLQKGRLPNFILYDDMQMDDLQYFILHQGNLPLGIDRTFNFGPFFVTSLVYKNQRVTRKHNKDNPLFLKLDCSFPCGHKGPVKILPDT